MRLRLTPDAADSTAEALFITGSMRSGTTMMMRLVATLHEVEMVNEPPILYALFPLITDVDPDLWRYLFDAALFEDRLVMSLRGKNLNLNQNDDACIRHFKTDQEVGSRLGSMERRARIVESARGKTIAFKLPEMTYLLPKYRMIHPHGTQIIMLREPGAVVASMVARGYFSDDEILGPPVKWPLHRRTDGNFPFWLPEEEHEEWRRIGQQSRCYRAYIHQYDNYVGGQGDILIDYDWFVANPSERFNEITERLGLRTGELTASLLDGVRRSKGDNQRPCDQAARTLARQAANMYGAMLEGHRYGGTESVGL